MNISKLAPAEALEAITAMETVEQLREAADSINLKYSGNTGEGTLRKNLNEAVMNKVTDDVEPKEDDKSDVPDFGGEDFNVDEIQSTAGPAKKGPSMSDLLEMDPNEITDPQLLRQVVRAKAMRLHRVRITNLDPSDAQLNGAIITVVNKYTGKVAKYVPFGDESANGYHLPEIILEHIKNQKFALRKEIKGGAFGVKRYKTTMVNKFSIEELKPLTKKEIEELAAHQRASHAIDN